MKILMVLDHEFPSDIRVENEATALISAGNQVHIACYTQKDRPRTDTFKGIAIHRISINKFIYKSSVAALTFPHYFNFWRRFLSVLLSREKFDVIHIHDLPLAKVGAELKDKFGVKLVLDLHENWPALLRVATHTNTFLGKLLSPNFLWVKYEKIILKSADRIIVVVDEAKERLKNLGIDYSKVEVVSNTLNEVEFGIPNLQPDSNYFTLYYAGGINLHRGLQTVIEALPIALEKVSNVRFRIAGSGSYQKELEQLAIKLNVKNSVEFLGHLSLADVAKNLAMCNAALIPHLKTDHTDSTIPHKLFQYMYINKPIIASNCTPIERIIKETTSGLVFISGNAHDLAEKIVLLATKQIEIALARSWVETKYNWKVDAAKLTELYNSL